MSNELLSMFRDDDFVPHAYLDAIFSSTSLSSGQSISTLQNRSTTLLKQFDYYTNELTTELETQIEKLRSCNSIVSYSYDDQSLRPTTRLEYYVDSLTISTQSLNESIDAVKVGLKNHETGMKKLLQYHQIKDNLKKVLEVLETIQAIMEISFGSSETINNKSAHHSITPNELTNALLILSQTIRDQLMTKLATEDEYNVDEQLMTKITEFVELSPLFKNLGDFANIYTKFSREVSGEKERYLSGKVQDDEEILK